MSTRWIACLVLTVSAAGNGAYALGTGFTYQGQLVQSGVPATGPCDFQFSLWDAAGSGAPPSGGNQIGNLQTVSGVTVSNGVFTVQLNGSGEFGASAFGGNDRWVQMAVRCPAGSGSYSAAFSPRQPLTAAPYALYAPAAGSAGALSCSGCVTSGTLAPGAVTGSGIALGTIQQSNLAFTPVVSVAASDPLASSGGQNPSISLNGVVAVENGGTGAFTTWDALTNLGAAARGANSDITELSGITGNIYLPDSSDANTGNIFKGASPFLHNFGFSNIFLGAGAGNFTNSAQDAVGIGSQALHSLTTGSRSIAIGSSALYSTTSGLYNVAIGDSTLNTNVTGNFNVALGTSALAGVSGDGNTGLGHGAGGNAALSGTYNTLVGHTAGSALTTGSNNTLVGAGAAGFATTGSSNIAIGNGAGIYLTTGSNNIDIGNVGATDEANTIRFGTQGTQTKAFIAGVYGVAGTGNTAVVTSTGQLVAPASSRRYKEDIRSMTDTDVLMRMRPVTFRYKPELDPEGITQYGLIAEEVAEVMPDLVNYDPQGRPESIRYNFLAPMLLNQLQKEHRSVDNLRKENAELRAQNVNLQQRLDHIEQTVRAIAVQLERSPTTSRCADGL